MGKENKIISNVFGSKKTMKPKHNSQNQRRQSNVQSYNLCPIHMEWMICYTQPVDVPGRWIIPCYWKR